MVFGSLEEHFGGSTSGCLDAYNFDFQRVVLDCFPGSLLCFFRLDLSISWLSLLIVNASSVPGAQFAFAH